MSVKRRVGSWSTFNFLKKNAVFGLGLGLGLQAARPIRSTSYIWVVTRHQYGITALVSQISFGGETVGGVAKCRLFSQASFKKSGL